METWKEARDALPIAVRQQYSGCFRMAERLEPVFDAVIETWTKTRAVVAALIYRRVSG